MKLDIQSRFKGWNHSPLFVLLITLFFSGAASYFIFLDTQAELLARLERTERRIQHSVQSRMMVYMNTLISVRSYLSSEKKTSRAGFARYIQGLSIRTKFPGLIALNFIKKVDAKDLSSHLRQVQKEGFPRYKVWPPSLGKQLMPLYFLEPFDEINQKAFGFDMMSETIRREALELARDTGNPTATKKIEFVQETQSAETPVNKHYGFDIFIPLYEPGLPLRNIEQRRKALIGFVASPFHVDELFDEILSEENFQRDLITYQVYDGPFIDKNNLIYSPAFIKEDAKVQLQRIVPIPFAMRRWTLHLKTLPAFNLTSSVNSHWMVLGLGFLASFLLYFFLLSAFRHAEKTEKNEHQLRLITNALPVLISYIDRFSVYKFINKTYSDWFGQVEDQYLGRTLSEVFGPEISILSESFRQRALNGETVTFDSELMHQTKGLRKLHSQYLPDFQKNGTIAGIIGLATDVTAERDTQNRIKEQARTVEIINQVVLSLQAETQLEKILQYVVDAATEISKAQFGVFYHPITTFQENTPAPFKVSGLTQFQKTEIFSQKNIHQFELTAQATKIMRSNDVAAEIDFGFNPFLTEESVDWHVRSYLSVPIMARTGQLEGTLYLGHSETDVFTEQAERVVAGIAAQAAVAIDSAKLYEALSASEKHAHSLAHQQAFLAEAGQVLNSTLDFSQILKNLNQIVIPELADWCIIHMLNPQGKIEQCAVSHQNPTQSKRAEKMHQQHPILMSSLSGPGKVIRTGEAELLSVVIFQSLKSDPMRHYMSTLRFKSYVAVPLRTRDRVIGCLELATIESKKKYAQADLELLEDLASRVSVAIENAQLYAEAQTVNRIKDEFLATLSHELRTPLNVILGHAEILKTEASQFGNDLALSVDAIYRNASIQNQIIGDLLDISGIITGKISFHPHLISPNEILTAAVESIRFTAEAKQINLKLITDGIAIKISGDATRFQQIIWNLLSNAVKFTPKGGSVSITSCKDSFSRFIIEVCDTGEGIDANFIPYVFDRFRQEDSSLTRRFGGLGLGLSIVRQLVELHGGSIQVQSAGKNKGSLFRVSFPESSENVSRPLGENKTRFSITELNSASLDQIRILVLDDEPDTRDLMAQLLIRAGARIQLASSVIEAFEKYETFRPQIIISDIGLPFEDGYSFIQRVRAHERTTGEFTPAAALTAYAREEDKSKALSNGFQIHVSKPISGNELVQKIAELTEKYLRPRLAELTP